MWNSSFFPKEDCSRISEGNGNLSLCIPYYLTLVVDVWTSAPLIIKYNVISMYHTITIICRGLEKEINKSPLQLLWSSVSWWTFFAGNWNKKWKSMSIFFFLWYSSFIWLNILAFENWKKKIENCTILIPKGNSYCRLKSSARGLRCKVSSEGLSAEIDIPLQSPIQVQNNVA